jgi:hypothetical protein
MNAFRIWKIFCLITFGLLVVIMFISIIGDGKMYYEVCPTPQSCHSANVLPPLFFFIIWFLIDFFFVVSIDALQEKIRKQPSSLPIYVNFVQPQEYIDPSAYLAVQKHNASPQDFAHVVLPKNG